MRYPIPNIYGTPTILFSSSDPLISDLEIVRLLSSSGADVNAEDDDSWTPLLNATKEGHLEVVKFLVDNGAKLEHR